MHTFRHFDAQKNRPPEKIRRAAVCMRRQICYTQRKNYRRQLCFCRVFTPTASTTTDRTRSRAWRRSRWPGRPGLQRAQPASVRKRLGDRPELSGRLSARGAQPAGGLSRPLFPLLRAGVGQLLAAAGAEARLSDRLRPLFSRPAGRHALHRRRQRAAAGAVCAGAVRRRHGGAGRLLLRARRPPGRGPAGRYRRPF